MKGWAVRIKEDVVMVNESELKTYYLRKGEVYDIEYRAPGVGYWIAVRGETVLVPFNRIHVPFKKQ